MSAHADEIRFLKSGPEALSARLKIISQAKSSIAFMTYEMAPCDSTSKLLIKALADKARENVHVSFILDAYEFNKRFSLDERAGLSAYLKEAGVSFYLYNKSPILFVKNHRNHIKFLIVDNKHYIVGGRNSTDSYFGLAKDLNYRDQDLLISGASAKSAQAAFNTVIKEGSFSRVKPAASSASFVSTCLAKNKRDSSVEAAFASASIVNSLPIHSCSSVTVVADNPDFLNSGTMTNHHDDGLPAEEYMNELRLRKKHSSRFNIDFISAASRLVSENQYYLPTGQLLTAFKSLRTSKDDKKVIVFTNRTGEAGGLTAAFTALKEKAARDDSEGNQVVIPVSGLGSLNDKNALTYKSARWRIHTKSAVRDSRDVLIGSFNFDPRSYHTNLESSVVIKNCPSLAKAVEKHIMGLKTVFLADEKSCASCKKEVDVNFLDYLNGIFVGNFL